MSVGHVQCICTKVQNTVEIFGFLHASLDSGHDDGLIYSGVDSRTNIQRGIKGQYSSSVSADESEAISVKLGKLKALDFARKIQRFRYEYDEQEEILLRWQDC